MTEKRDNFNFDIKNKIEQSSKYLIKQIQSEFQTKLIKSIFKILNNFLIPKIFIKINEKHIL